MNPGLSGLANLSLHDSFGQVRETCLAHSSQDCLLVLLWAGQQHHQCGLEQPGRTEGTAVLCPPARVEVTVPSNNNKREITYIFEKTIHVTRASWQGSINACTHTFLLYIRWSHKCRSSHRKWTRQKATWRCRHFNVIWK